MSETAEIRDPVCGKAVDPLRARAVGIFGGVTHYFCSLACKSQYVDPRTATADRPASGPGGVERRSQSGEDAPTGASGEWFAKGAVAPAAPAVERFDDLESRPPPSGELRTASPSLMLEVEASRRGTRTWLWVLVLALVGGALLVLGLRR